MPFWLSADNMWRMQDRYVLMMSPHIVLVLYITQMKILGGMRGRERKCGRKKFAGISQLRLSLTAW